MSDYSQITFFTPKDSLATGNPNKIIYGSDVDAELSAISTAIATKADVDGDAIGAGTPATELSVDNLKLDANKIISTNTDGDIELEPNGAGYVVITNVDINAGNIDNTVIGATTAVAGTFTTANATTVDTTNLEVTNLKAKDGTSAGSIADLTGVVTLASSVLTTTDVNGGTIDGAVIGGATPAAITGTTLTANTSLALATGATVTAILDEDNMVSDSATALATQQSIKAYVDAQVTAQDLDVTTDSGTIAIDLDSETLTVAGGTGLDTSATGNTVTVAIDSTVATLTGAQTLTNKVLTSPDINTPDIDGGTIDGATIATSDITVGAGKTLDVSAGTLTLANDQISGDKIEGGTIGSVTITTADINGGAIDGTVIGGATPAAGSFTTGQFGTSLNVDGTVTADGLDVDGTGTYLLSLNNTSQDARIELSKSGTQYGQVSVGTNEMNLVAVGASTDMRFLVNSSERMRIDSSGNVGIGDTSPSTYGKLVVAGSTPFAVVRSTDVTTAGFSMLVNSGSNGVGSIATDSGGHMTFDTGSTGAGQAERARITSGGDLLVGRTVTPPTAGAKIAISGSGDTAVQITKEGVIAGRVSAVSTGLAFGVDGSDGATERMRIDASGKLLVGLTTNATAGPVQAAVTGTGTSFQTNPAVFGAVAGAAGREVPMVFGSDGTNAALISMLSGNMGFFTQSTERMRITSSGNLLVGTTSAPSASNKGLAIQDNGSSGKYIASATNITTTYSHFEVINPNGTVGSIQTNGSATSYNTSSDYRLKDVDGPITNSGAYIDALKPVQGSWKADGSRFIGLIAHEVQEVSETQIATGEKDGEEMQGMDYSAPELIANLIAEIQSLRARVAQLEGA